MRKKGRKGGRIEPDFSGPYTIEAINGKLATLANLKGVTLNSKYSLDHLKPYKQRRPKSDYSTNKSPQKEVAPETRPVRPSVIVYAPPCQHPQDAGIDMKKASIEERAKVTRGIQPTDEISTGKLNIKSMPLMHKLNQHKAPAILSRRNGHKITNHGDDDKSSSEAYKRYHTQS
uniref:Uncharacterized protein n=1 Tax=Knipowitschia caucasica TaxID=637954 RepID=A0AAV2KTG1_KNICA